MNIDVDKLANYIRSINGENKMGTGALAENICEWLGEQRSEKPYGYVREARGHFAGFSVEKLEGKLIDGWIQFPLYANNQASTHISEKPADVRYAVADLRIQPENDSYGKEYSQGFNDAIENILIIIDNRMSRPAPADNSSTRQDWTRQELLDEIAKLESVVELANKNTQQWKDKADNSSAAPSGISLSVKLAEMRESNGHITWDVRLAKTEDAPPWDCHSVYSDSIKGRAEYEADSLKHFLGLGPRPDILAYDTDAPRSTVASPSPTAVPMRNDTFIVVPQNMRAYEMSVREADMENDLFREAFHEACKGDKPADAKEEMFAWDFFKYGWEAAVRCLR